MKDEEINKIPHEFMTMIEQNRDKEYLFKYDEDKSLDEQSLMRETREILAYIFMNYLGTEEQKQSIENKLKKELIKNEMQKKEKYPVDVFKNKKTDEVKETQSTQANRQNIFSKITEKIKSIF